MGAPEFIILIYIVGFAWWGYNAGAKREIGSTAGLLLGLILGIIGIIIVLCSRKINYEQNYYTHTNAESTVDQLKKYKDLLDSGAINEVEYNIKKGELLNK